MGEVRRAVFFCFLFCHFNRVYTGTKEGRGGAVGARESSAGVGSSDAAAEAAPSTGDTAAPDASVERAAKKLTLVAGSSSEICGERGASTHPFDPGTVFPLEVRYYKGSWLQHGSSCSSKSNSSSSRSNSNDNTGNHDSWWDVTCVGALLRPFDPGKRHRQSAKRGLGVWGIRFSMSKGLGGNIGCRDKTSSWYQTGSPI